MAAARKPSEEEIAIARVYARAALSLAEPQGLAETVLEELELLLEELDRDAAFEAFLTSPLVEAQQRRGALDRIFRGRLNELLLDTLQVMNSKGRSGLLRALAEAYRQELDKLRGRIRVRVETAVPLTGALRLQLQQAVSSYSGKQVSLEESIDESLVGGVVLHVADRKIDSSVARELRRLGQRLLERASHEIHGGRTFFEESI